MTDLIQHDSNSNARFGSFLLQKNNYLVKIITLVLIIFCNVSSFSQCPTVNENGVFDKSEDIVWTTYHGHLAKAAEGFVTWCEDMAANGSDAITMTLINSTNGYNYTGTPIMFCATGNASAQAFLLTTTGLYSWGATTEVVGGSIVSSNAFSSMTLPSGVTSADVLDIKSNNGVFFLVTVPGAVWVAGQNVANVSGNSSSTANTWHQVEVSAGVPITGVEEITGSREVVYVRKSDNTLWAWGQGIALGGGAGKQDKTYATQMDLTAIPVGVTLSQIGTYMDNLANSSGLLALGSDEKVYGIGYDGAGELITNTGSFVSDWITVKNSSGGDLTNVVFLATSDNTEEYASASIITKVSGATNNLYTWGESNTDNIGQGTNGLVANPTIPQGFTEGSDNPVYTSVGGHAASYLNSISGGSICFVGHVSNGSGAGLQTESNSDFFECFNSSIAEWPSGVTLCLETLLLAQDDNKSSDINVPKIIDVVANDNGPNLDPTTVTTGGSLLSPSNGTITNVNSTTGAITYTPNLNFTGTETFEYSVCDAGGSPCDTATVTIIISYPDGDGDGIMDDVDIDDDNDGITDVVESGGIDPSADADADGTPNYIDPNIAGYVDTNSDGVNDNLDADLDGIPNHLDVDADNDGIPDAIEANGGASPSNYDAATATISGAVGANGMPDAAETSAESGVSVLPITNTDSTGNPDYLDIDADNDGITDAIEAGGVDANGDGIIDGFTDANEDGLDDATLSTPLAITNSD